MVKNISHADLMDDVYTNQRHIYDLTRKYYLLGRDRAIEELSLSPGQSILEIGCGTGRNLIVAARRFPEARLFGMDISTEMLTTAKSNIYKAGVQDRVVLAQGDASDFDPKSLFGLEKFDRVLMSYTLSMIPPWETAIEKGLDALHEDGKLVFVDFWDQSELPGWSKHLLAKWLELFHVAPRESLKNVAEEVAEAADRKCHFKPIYRGYACLGTISA
ncbi:MAG: class I SAM-dependent methyltransferase [Pseudomonadota bacterium]